MTNVLGKTAAFGPFLKAVDGALLQMPNGSKWQTTNLLDVEYLAEVGGDYLFDVQTDAPTELLIDSVGYPIQEALSTIELPPALFDPSTQVGVGDTTTSGTLSMTLPSFTEGDLGFIMVVSSRAVSDDAYIPLPYCSGWELMVNEVDSATGTPTNVHRRLRHWILWREMEAGDSTALTVSTPSAGGNSAGICFTVSNADPYADFAANVSRTQWATTGVHPDVTGTDKGLIINGISSGSASARALSSDEGFEFVDTEFASGTNVNRSVAAAVKELVTDGAVTQPAWNTTWETQSHAFAVPVRTGPPTVGSLTDEITALGPYGYWKMNETSGSTMTNSANPQNGTYAGDFLLADELGADGDSYVRLGSSSRGIAYVNDITQYTVSSTGLTLFCMFMPDVTSTGYLIIKTDPGVYEYAFYQNSSNLFGVFWTGGGATVSSGSVGSGQGVVNTVGQWNMAAFTVDQTPTQGRPFSLYTHTKDNPLSPTSFSSTTSTPTANTSAKLYVGDRGDNVGGYYRGAIGHVALFTRKLYAYEWRRLRLAAQQEGWF